MEKNKFNRTKASATRTLYAVMKEMSRRGGSIPAKEISPFVNGNVELTEWEKEPAGKNDKMTDDDKNMLPLKRISFLGNNE